MKQTEVCLVHYQEKNCRYDHIPFILNAIKNIIAGLGKTNPGNFPDFSH